MNELDITSRIVILLPAMRHLRVMCFEFGSKVHMIDLKRPNLQQQSIQPFMPVCMSGWQEGAASCLGTDVPGHALCTRRRARNPREPTCMNWEYSVPDMTLQHILGNIVANCDSAAS